MRGRWLVAALMLRASALATDVSQPEAPLYGATLLHAEKAPLRTSGRYIVDKKGERVKWSCVSWYGAYSTTHAVGGLEVRKMDEIVDRIVELGFNCVRMMYSTQGWKTDPLIADDVVSANPELRGKRFQEVFDLTIEAMTNKGLMVIINNHNSKSGWCCHYSQDEGLWYVPEYPEEDWIASLVFLAERYRNNPMVVAIDLRNEVHDYQDTHLTWGGGNEKTDWAAAAVRAGNEVLAVSPDVLIVVMAMCFGMDLRPMRDMPLKMTHPNRIVYQTHNYLEFQVMDNIAKIYAPWHVIRHFAGLVVFGLACLVSTFAYGWCRIGKPKPPRGLLTVSIFGWLFLFSCCAAAFCYKMYAFGMQFCEVIVESDLMPWIRLAVGTAGVSLLLLLNGVRQFVMGRYRQVEDEEAGPEDAGRPLSPKDAVARAPSELWVPGERHGVQPPAFHDREKADVASSSSEDSAEDEVSGCSCSRKVGYFASSLHMRVALFRDAERLSVRMLSWLGFAEPPRGKLEVAMPAEWDLGMFLMLQIAIIAIIVAGVMTAIYITAHIVPTYWWMEKHLDRMWGFALEEGHEYTAPVWMGEFGAGVRGQWWLNFVRYLSTRDVDWAYWAVNGKKWSEGYITATGQFVNYDYPRWDGESYGVLQEDYDTVRHPWKLLDMQALMASPATWTPDAMPCSSSIDPACQG